MAKKGTTEEVPTPPLETPVPSEGNAVRIFRAKCDTALANINNLQQFRDSDTMVEFVVATGRSLFDNPLDMHTPDSLLRIGGKLTGAYAYLGQLSARARAERDVYEQKADEVEKELVLKYVGNKYKVTEAKAKASAEMEELAEFVIQKDAAKNQWEAIANACQTMIMFIQSAIRVKDAERYAGKRQHDAG